MTPEQYKILLDSWQDSCHSYFTTRNSVNARYCVNMCQTILNVAITDEIKTVANAYLSQAKTTLTLQLVKYE
jgi:hypothetical protein